MDNQSKMCRKCGETKPIALFYKKSASAHKGMDYSASSAGYSHNCKECDKQLASERRKRLGQVHVNYMKDLDLRRKYGLCLEDYNKMFVSQSGCCAICDKHQTNFKKGLVVDHDHVTGKVRKLLCPNCNAAIGMLGEDIGLLAKAIEYIQSHAAGSGISTPTASGKDAENGAKKDANPLH